ncbi:trans-aconitate 2-methyltransferase [uncultured Ramlibacter sp.]|uniref:class I SAM-dependent methyltransferase n=1 Tax=uncultured Ramlibacter sp. TaxID=260755 RepID=UPI0026164312|nr:class I SAM-dependent methyltransferase [uncultured Ramlibacter sp.]
MSLRVHDDVARQYNSDDGIIAAKNQAVLEGLKQRFGPRAAALRVADLGVGDGAQLQMLTTLACPLAMTGLDVSPAMLRLAAQRVPLTAVLAPAQDAAAHLPHGAFDLVLAHFVLAYVQPRDLLAQVRQLLAPAGVLSLATTVTEGGAPFYAALESTFRHSWNPLRRAIAWAADRALARSHMPADFQALEAELQASGLRCLARRTLRMPVRFDTPDEAYRFGIEEGWAVNILAVPGVPLGAAKWLARYGLRQCSYPFEVTQVIEILEVGAA